MNLEICIKIVIMVISLLAIIGTFIYQSKHDSYASLYIALLFLIIFVISGLSLCYSIMKLGANEKKQELISYIEYEMQDKDIYLNGNKIPKDNITPEIIIDKNYEYKITDDGIYLY